MEMAKEQNLKKASTVRDLRQKAGWSQAQLADIAGVTERTIQRLEKDGIGSHETWMGVAQAFDKSVSDFEISEISEKEQQELLKKLRVLVWLKTGKSVLDLTTGAHAFHSDSPQPKDKDEAELFGTFFQQAFDWGEIWSDVSHAHRMDAYLEIDQLIKELDSKGFLVFGELRDVYIKSQSIPDSKPRKWKAAVLVISEKVNPAVVDDGKGNRLLPSLYSES